MRTVGTVTTSSRALRGARPPRLVAAPVVGLGDGATPWRLLHLPASGPASVPALNEYAIERAVLLLEADRSPGPGLVVRLTAGALRDRRRVEHLLRRCDDVPAARGRLMVGVPETAAFEDFRAVTRLADGLAERGLRPLLLDTSVGWLAMAALRELPWHTLAITRRLSDGWDRSARARAVTRSIVEQAREADVPTLAFGVDSAERRVLAGRLGVQLVAGAAAGAVEPAFRPRERTAA